MLNKKRILVVDDEPDIVLWIKIILEQYGFIVDYYCNPIIALEEFKSNFYDLIILDINMSYINGLKLYREIRKKDLNSKICLITAGEMKYDLKNKFYPVYNFIRKPIENKELLTTINNLVNKNKQSHQKV